MITSDEIQIGDHNRASIDLEVRALGAGAVLSCRGQVSGEGQDWVDARDLSLHATSPGSWRTTGHVSGALLRLVFEHESLVADPASFAVQVHLDHS